jgi:hypothetical protein
VSTWPWNSHPVTCVRAGCGHGFTVHEAGGGECRAFHEAGRPCLCAGFRWVDAEGTEHGGYRGGYAPAHQVDQKSRQSSHTPSVTSSGRIRRQ